MANISAKKLLAHSLATENAELTALIIIAGSLETLHILQAHQPASLPERAQHLFDFLAPSKELAPVAQPAR